ncbi:hypothetical protein BLNAU_21728 [Blattamonas nauphoetae]|uniref:DUF4485 domain-containing protein n=1 Tax=Blattamonas nauphoetae TaxID=2049346 RepID=A0ABQ9WV47_9EUKA|nr:hypothetical protein BLNAU_21728 [Blattamonas nauphoetae]
MQQTPSLIRYNRLLNDQSRLSEEFQHLSRTIRLLSLSYDRQQQVRTDKWLTRLGSYASTSSPVEWQLTRNNYARVLIAMLRSGRTEPPFSSLPPDSTTLPPLPFYWETKVIPGKTHVKRRKDRKRIDNKQTMSKISLKDQQNIANEQSRKITHRRINEIETSVKDTKNAQNPPITPESDNSNSASQDTSRSLTRLITFFHILLVF